MKTDQLLNLDNVDFNQQGEVPPGNLVSNIATQCGFSSAGGADFTGVRNLTKIDLVGKTCRQVLEMLSSAACGYFKATTNNVLKCVQFGSAVSAYTPTNYAPVGYGSVKGEITKVIVEGNSKTFTEGTGDVFNTLKVNTELASAELATAIFGRVNGYTYTAWDCDKSILPYHMEIDGGFTLANNTVLVANSIIEEFTSTGIYAKVGRNEVTESEFNYDGALTRKLNEKIGDGEKLGNGYMLTKYQGGLFVGEEYQDEQGNVKSDMFGYSQTSSKGVVEFSGAMTSKIVPSAVSANSDATSATYTLGDKQYQLGITWSGDNITNVTKTEVTAP